MMQTRFARYVGHETVKVENGTGSWPVYVLEGKRHYRTDLPPGTLYFVAFHPDVAKYQCPHEPTCERHLHVVCPNGRHWDIDSRASNCTLPEDKVHHCWVRHGDPISGAPVHVDKNGVTCAAGGGSIIIGDYHGFLHNGVFTDNL